MAVSTQSRLPTFLHVGAAKSGTRSLYFYLRQHPEIFMSPVKGPEFFVPMFRNGRGHGPGDQRKPIIEDLEEYQSLFKGADSEKVIGEGSVSYLYHHDEAIPLIRKYHGDPRILITLRDPVDHAFSCYLHLKRQKRETLSFEDGLAQERERMEKGWHYHWHYFNSGLFADQVAAYQKNFSHVKVCLLEDMRCDPQGYVRDIFQFLDVDKDFTPDLSTRYNIGGIPRSNLLYRLVVGGNRSRPRVLELAGHLFGEERLIRWREAMRTKLLARELLRADTRAEMIRSYRLDVLRLQDMLGRDLSNWLQETPGP
jgi:hypothetical protein